MCGLANNGRGMKPSDMVVTIGSCLKKGRKIMYDNIFREATESQLIKTDPWLVYSKIKDKILQHTETAREKQIRVRGEWRNLVRGRDEPILDYEARWEDKLKKMDRCGLDRTKDEMLIDYLDKIGEQYSKLIRYDRRTYPNEQQPRFPESWQEAHAIAYEIERHTRDSEAIRKEGGGQHHGGLSTSGGMTDGFAAQPQGDLLVPGYSGATAEVPPPSPILRP